MKVTTFCAYAQKVRTRGPALPGLDVVRRFAPARTCDDVERVYREELKRLPEPPR